MNIIEKIYKLLRIQTYDRVLEKASLYFINNSVSQIEKYQIEKFNKIWRDAYTHIAFYHEYKTKHQLPDTINSMHELTLFPIITKKDLQLNNTKLLRDDLSPTGTTMSGGSTGEPLKLPTRGFSQDPGSNMWIGRIHYKIKPHEKTFVIWGHRHLNGKGIKKNIRLLTRDIKDYLSNFKRVSAYDLSQEAMTDMYNKLIKFKPSFILGYSSALTSFCKINHGKNIPFKVKAVLCTASTLSKDDQHLVEDFFNAPVCKEYGSHETAVMAGTIPSNGKYRVYWDTHIIQGVRDNEGLRNIVTVLYENYFPIIRYDIGDYIVVPDNANLDNILEIDDVIGRPNDIIQFSNGASFNCIFTAGCVKQIKSVISHQVHKYDNGFEVWIVALKYVTAEELNHIHDLLLDLCPPLKKIKIRVIQKDSLQQSVAGKTPLVINHPGVNL